MVDESQIGPLEGAEYPGGVPPTEVPVRRGRRARRGPSSPGAAPAGTAAPPQDQAPQDQEQTRQDGAGVPTEAAAPSQDQKQQEEGVREEAQSSPPASQRSDSQQGENVPPEVALAEMRDRWQRAQAELDNTRKRLERQLADERRAERARVVSEWLPILDNLELALRHAEADPEAILTGVAAVRGQALSVLNRLGFNRVPDVGTRFNPALHEAARLVQPSHAEPGTVVEVLRPGYAAEDGLLRPAAVVVASERD
jgi:molecular chaperone GrpE